MYCVGAPATHYFPVSIPYHGCALNITVQSYLDTLDWGLVAARELVPDLEVLADLLIEEIGHLAQAVGAKLPVAPRPKLAATRPRARRPAARVSSG